MPLDALCSPDPVIRAAAERRQELQAERDRLDQLLVTYATHVSTQKTKPAVLPIEHFSMLDAPICGCSWCTDWEVRRNEYIKVAELVPKGHKWSVCGCDKCRFVGRVRLNFLAATNRRDLLIEMAFHAHFHSRHGPQVMAWLHVEMAKPNYDVNWCAQEMSRYPLEWWMRRCEMSVSGAISGAVFTEAAGALNLESSIGSSLGGESTLSLYL